MSLSKWIACCSALLLSLGLSSLGQAQLYQPFIDPGQFNHDLQFFAPAEYEEYGGEHQSNTGWFGSYDRLYVWVSRPQQEQSYTQMDSTWGNRFNFGYMTQENHGWLFNIWHIDGPNENEILVTQRLNQWNDVNDGVTTPTTVFPTTNRNDPETRERTYDVAQSINNMKYSSFEINKTFRMEPFHHGLHLEPFFGFRYGRVTDYTRAETYGRFTALGVAVGPFPPPNLNTALVERFNSLRTTTINDLVGGQLGLRAFQQHSRWLLSSEIRMFAAQNFQQFNQVDYTETTQYGAIAIGSIPTLFVNSQTTAYAHASEFVVGGEVRMDAAFELTRDVSLQFGFNVLEIGRGIGRGSDFTRNSEDLTIFGLNFGLTVNR